MRWSQETCSLIFGMLPVKADPNAIFGTTRRACRRVFFYVRTAVKCDIYLMVRRRYGFGGAKE